VCSGSTGIRFCSQPVKGAIGEFSCALTLLEDVEAAARAPKAGAAAFRSQLSAPSSQPPAPMGGVGVGGGHSFQLLEWGGRARLPSASFQLQASSAKTQVLLCMASNA
jgi:hypothetical protein